MTNGERGKQIIQAKRNGSTNPNLEIAAHYPTQIIAIGQDNDISGSPSVGRFGSVQIIYASSLGSVSR